MKRALVTGAGGFIGHHLCRYLKEKGYEEVRGIDLVEPQWGAPSGRFINADLRTYQPGLAGIDEVYHLACDMGGIGFISQNLASVLRNNLLIDLNMLQACVQAAPMPRFFFASSACVYNQKMQAEPDVTPLSEDMAYPADPEPGYGWAKLTTEQACAYYARDYSLQVRIARFHNVFGPEGTYDGGREKAPAALSRKIALAEDGGEIEVWGDGQQTRSFLYIFEALQGIDRIMHSDCPDPLNLGSEEIVSIEDLAYQIAGIAGKAIRPRFDPSKPQGVRGRNSNNRRLREVTGWAPAMRLADGLIPTYRWIEQQVKHG